MNLRRWLALKLDPPADLPLRAVVIKTAEALRDTFPAHGVVCVALKNPSAKRLKRAVEAMPTLCHGHDQLRALVGRLERIAGVRCPQYDPGPLDRPAKCARTGTCAGL